MNTKRKKQKSTRINYQTLEDRRLLAGDVRVATSQGAFYIRGDGASNQVEVVKSLHSSDITVRGLEGTTINGQTEILLTGPAARVIKGFRASMGPGDDFIRFEDTYAEGRTVVYGGIGNDSIGFYRATVSDITVQTYTGDDAISIDKLIVNGDFRVYALEGNDTVGISGLRAFGQNTIATHGGDDLVSIENSAIYRSFLRVLTGEGNDFFGSENISVATSSAIFTGDGADQVSLFDTNFNGQTYVGGQAGYDEITVAGRERSEDTLNLSSFEGDLEFANGKTQRTYNNLIRNGIRLGTISELLRLNPNLSTVSGALEATGFNGKLDDDTSGAIPYTLFAPLNSAFDDLPSDFLDGLSTGELRDVLRFHVSPGDLQSEELVQRDEVFTLLRESFSVDVAADGVFLNGDVTLFAVDIRAKNGVIHVVEKVLLPPDA